MSLDASVCVCLSMHIAIIVTGEDLRVSDKVVPRSWLQRALGLACVRLPAARRLQGAQQLGLPPSPTRAQDARGHAQGVSTPSSSLRMCPPSRAAR
jgi:hypothetical protein